MSFFFEQPYFDTCHCSMFRALANLMFLVKSTGARTLYVSVLLNECRSLLRKKVFVADFRTSRTTRTIYWKTKDAQSRHGSPCAFSLKSCQRATKSI